VHVDGAGPVPCEFAIVGPYVGRVEDRTGIPFSGDSGDELDRYLNGRELPLRDDVYLTNLHKVYRGKDYVYDQADVDLAWPELQKELAKVKPKILITLGREVTRLFLGDVDITDVESIPWYLPESIELPHAGNWAKSGIIVFPIVHIAAGLRNPEMSPLVVKGFTALSEFLDGELEPRVLFDDPIREPVYEEITDETQLRRSLSGLSSTSSLSIDTEGWPGKPWSLQYSDRPGIAHLIRRNSPALLKQFISTVQRIQPRLVFHSALHDLGMGRSLETDFEGLSFDDTMVMAYLLQLEPQGLKASCLRHCNMKMQDYSDVLGDVSNRLAREYLTWIWEVEQVDYEKACHDEFIRQTSPGYRDSKGKVWPKGRRLKKDPQLPKPSLLKAVTRVLQSKRPRELWEDQIEDIQVAGYHRLGALPEATLDYVEPATAIHYGCRDADGTTRLRTEYRRRIDALGLGDVYELELSTYPLLDRMQRAGIKPDLDHFRDLSTVLQYEIDKLRHGLSVATGREDFNANSGDQVADYLFGVLGLEEVKLTKGGRGSTNDKILEALERENPQHSVLSSIRSYRELYKLKNTFVDRLPDFVDRWPFDGRIHTTLRTTRVVTGRLAASDPNMLAQPEHGDWADDFKRGWVCEDGHVIWAGDESQIELRGLAHLSQDPVLLAVYRGELRNPDGSLIDLHAKLAQRIFGGNIEEYMHKCRGRLAAKAINFGIPMGMTCRGLSVELRKNGVEADEETAQRWLDETLGLYAGVARYMEERKQEARRHGFVRCLSGRIRYIGGIRSRNDRVREEAERFAFSTPIQESATFIMKQAEAIVWSDVLPYFWKQGKWVEPLIQVHDCLKLECQEDMVRDLNAVMIEAMTNVPKSFSVPLAVESEWGYNMADVHKFEEVA
jgi:uracil-DNA glycosylase family 4